MMGDDDIEDWDDFEEVDLSKKRYVSDEAREKISTRVKSHWEDGLYDSQKFSQEQCIQKFRQVHDDKYDYSKVEYVTQKTKVIIICPIHGDFSQSPNAHWNGSGCFKCNHNPLRSTREEIIERFREVHGDRYDYSKFQYLGTKKKSVIICKIHGEFTILPMHHIKGTGCQKCRLIIHLDFQLVVDLLCDGKSMKSVASKVGFSPPAINRQIYKMRKDGTLSQYLKGRVLPDGRKNNTGKVLIKSNAEIIGIFKSVHGDKYDYSKVEYVNTKTKVIIICPIHGEFKQIPKSHKKGRGCQRCANMRSRKGNKP
jgi:hypothetical protein